MKLVNKIAFQKKLSTFLSLKAFSLFFLIFLAFYMNFLFVYQPLKVKKGLDQIYKKSFRQTLSRVEGPLIELGLDLRVLKIKEGSKIFLEFLSKNADNSYWLINSIELKGSREAYFDYRGEPSSLLISDDDGDGFLDIIAPTFNKFLWPHINLAVYNKQSKKFELRKTSSYSKVTTGDNRDNSFFSCGFWCDKN